MSFFKDIEAKIEALQAQIKQHSGIVSEAATAIENLAAQKSSSTSNLHILNGAIQAYQDVITGIKSGNISQVIEAVTPIVEAEISG